MTENEFILQDRLGVIRDTITKYVTEDSVEKEKDDDYFGIEAKKVVTL